MITIQVWDKPVSASVSHSEAYLPLARLHSIKTLKDHQDCCLWPDEILRFSKTMAAPFYVKVKMTGKTAVNEDSEGI